ncbi:MAG: hypothetical protein JXA30_07345 [Deltaproteobacteria bacterium]|nr:hypothetical protein [Deltaproteobacteria bacterium]
MHEYGGNTYRVQGCGSSATYVCSGGFVSGNSNTVSCVKESASTATDRIKARVGKSAAQAKTTRSYDEQKKLHVVRAEFRAVSDRAEILVLGAPQAELTKVLVRLKVRGVSGNRLQECEKLEVLINDEPFDGDNPRIAKSSNAWAIEASARFPFELFKPLGRRYATFGVRACETEVKLEEKQMPELLKFFEVFSQIAIDVQNETLQTRDADALSI